MMAKRSARMCLDLRSLTTIRAALAAAKSLSTVQTGKALEVKSLQEYLSER